MNERKLGISALSKLTGVKIETIRYYEREGLLSDPPRTEGGHRSYREKHIKNLVSCMKDQGMGMTYIQSKLPCSVELLTEDKSLPCMLNRELS